MEEEPQCQEWAGEGEPQVEGSLTLTTLQFLGSVHWKWRATRKMASRRSATSSVCLMFFALRASRSSSPKSREVIPDFLRCVLRRTTCGEDGRSVGKVATQKGETLTCLWLTKPGHF